MLIFVLAAMIYMPLDFIAKGNTRNAYAKQLYSEGKLSRRILEECLRDHEIKILYGYYDGDILIYPTDGAYNVWEKK